MTKEEEVFDGPLADPQKVGRKQSLANIEQKNNDFDLRWVLSTEQGRRFVRRLMLRCGERRSSMMNDSHWTSFYEGERNVHLWLCSEMERVAPQAVVMMLNESLKKMVREADEISQQTI